MANDSNLIPAEPGEIRNPKGRGKGVPNSKTRLMRLLDITENLTNPITKEVEGFSVAEQLDLAQIIKARRGDTRAYIAILDRLEGKPVQNVDMSVTGKASTEEKIKDFLDEPNSPTDDAGGQLAAPDTASLGAEVAQTSQDIS